MLVGLLVGSDVGIREGLAVGLIVGITVGTELGMREGVLVGLIKFTEKVNVLK
jgi:tetrahydromethanopterin S-methyltransferase subunit G